jgi:hypothetical protein
MYTPRIFTLIFVREPTLLYYAVILSLTKAHEIKRGLCENLHYSPPQHNVEEPSIPVRVPTKLKITRNLFAFGSVITV